MYCTVLHRAALPSAAFKVVCSRKSCVLIHTHACGTCKCSEALTNLAETHTHTNTKKPSQCRTARMRETLMSSALASDPCTQVSIICFFQWPQIGMRKKHLPNTTQWPHCDHMRRVHVCMCATKTCVGFKICNVFLEIQVIKLSVHAFTYSMCVFLLQYPRCAIHCLKVTLLCVFSWWAGWATQLKAGTSRGFQLFFSSSFSFVKVSAL